MAKFRETVVTDWVIEAPDLPDMLLCKGAGVEKEIDPIHMDEETLRAVLSETMTKFMSSRTRFGGRWTLRHLTGSRETPSASE